MFRTVFVAPIVLALAVPAAAKGGSFRSSSRSSFRSSVSRPYVSRTSTPSRSTPVFRSTPPTPAPIRTPATPRTPPAPRKPLLSGLKSPAATTGSSSRRRKASTRALSGAAYGGSPSLLTPGRRPARSRTVYIVRNGQKYHARTCRLLPPNPIPVSLANARAQGYERCGDCLP